MIEQETVNIKEAAGVLNVSVAYVERLLEDGELRFCLVNGKQLIRVDDVLDYKVFLDRQSAEAMQELHEMSEEQGLHDLEPIVEDDIRS